MIRLRMKLAGWILGDGWTGVISRLWLIRDRAMEAVDKSGQIIPEKSKPLAEALYHDVPGTWELHIIKVANQ
jgi:hypothetical protein